MKTPFNVFVHPTFGQITIEFGMNFDKLDFTQSIEVVQINLSKIKNNQNFTFFLSKPDNHRMFDCVRAVTLNDIDYNYLRGTILASANPKVGYSAKKLSVVEADMVNYVPKKWRDSGLSTGALVTLKMELENSLIHNMRRCKHQLAEQFKANYLRVLGFQAREKLEELAKFNEELEEISKSESVGKDDQPKLLDASQNTSNSLAYPI